MSYHAGLDVSLEHTSICIVDKDGTVFCESRVVTDPDDIAAFLEGVEIAFGRIGLEAGPLAPWLYVSS